MKNKNDFFEKRVEEKNEKWIWRKTIFAFSIFVLMLFAALFFWRWLNHQPTEQAALKPLRSTLNWNEKIFSRLFNINKLAKTYEEKDAVKNVRVNGDAGMDGVLEEKNWQLKVVRVNGDTLKISLAEIKKLPKCDVIFDFKCIEGWSQITHWGGVRLHDFISHYHLEAEAKMNYVGMQTPDKQYYVGIDMPSALHPQTILCYEMNGKELPQNQGFPLRLIIPVKYGVKHLKRIGTMFFSDEKPADYWAERGYDYYAGH